MTPFPLNAPGPDRRALRGRPPVAFTLVEVLLVVTLLGLVTLLFVNSASDLLRTREPRLDEIFWQGVTAARQLALETSQTVTLRYDQEKHALNWSTGPEGGRTLVFPGRMLEFLPVTEQGMVLLGGQLAETGAMVRVRFYSDGGCDAFRAQLTDNTGRRTVLAIDPWTCAPILSANPP